MARPIVVSNNSLHVGINKYGLVHDFYYPHVGLENHSAGKGLRHMIGVWVDGKISWVTSDEWQRSFSYPHDALIGHTRLTNEILGIILEFDDAVLYDIDAFVRNIHVINTKDVSREVRLFMHQAFVIADARSNQDTGQYLPDSNAILHYRGNRAFVVGGRSGGKVFDQFTIGLFGIEGREGTYRDAEDGELQCCTVEQGRVDSTVRFKLVIEPHESARVEYWVACGTSLREALYVHHQLQAIDERKLLDITARSWGDWLALARPVSDQLPEHQRRAFLRSMMIIKAHCDVGGGVIASTDSAMLNYSRDNYSYMWPRDGAYALWPLIRLGYYDEPLAFFNFCKKGMHTRGYLYHKYFADGSVGSSWHPYAHEGLAVGPPIQQDETATVLFAFAQFYHVHKKPKLLKSFYKSMVFPMAAWLATYIDKDTGLPLPSYDLWEEKYLTSTYTTSVTYAALLAAAELADIMHDTIQAKQWRIVANTIRKNAVHRLYDTNSHSFYKGLYIDKQKNIHHDTTLDTSSFYGLFMYGLLESNSEKMTNMLQVLESSMGSNGVIETASRYVGDNYCLCVGETIGNPWSITSLWMAQYYLECQEFDKADVLIRNVEDMMLADTSVLPEQVCRSTGKPMSGTPLVWAHAEYISTLMDKLTMEQK